MVSRCLSATGIRFSVILFPPGSWALLTVGLPGTPRRARTSTGFPRSAHTSCDREGALYTPGTTVLTPTEATTGRRLPLRSGQSLHPAAHPTDGASLNEA